MKKISFSLCFLFLSVWLMAQAQPTEAPKPDNLQVKEMSYDFGKIPQGKPVTHVFSVVNTGKESLILENVQASCGCTTPEWSKDPIPAGGSAEIKVGYNAAAEGAFTKSISIFYNKGQVKSIIIKGEVWKTPDQPAPKNNSLTLLKNAN
jgi:Protein of unknown function (DUF1573)